MKMQECPKYERCNANLCPLDPNAFRRTFRRDEAVCFYLREGVKNGSERHFQRGRIEQELWEVVQIVLPVLLVRYAPLKRAIDRAKRSGSRMARQLRKGVNRAA